MTKCPQPRPQRGNTLAMIAALTILFLLVALFVMLYLMMVRSSDEHRTAIDSAALAAAKDLSRIVINTDQFGYVGLTSSPPTGTDTNAGDNYFQEVHGINELTATARVDMIVANEIGDTFLRGLAQSELDNVKAVKDQLTTEINGAILPAGTAKDAAGQTLTPYLSAERVYLKNQAKNSIYVGGTMRLTFGGIEGGIETATPAPTPLSKAGLRARLALSKPRRGAGGSSTEVSRAGQIMEHSLCRMRLRRRHRITAPRPRCLHDQFSGWADAGIQLPR